MDTGLRNCGAIICALFSVTAMAVAIMVGSNLFVHEGESNTPAFLVVSGLAAFVGAVSGLMAVLLMRDFSREPSSSRSFPGWFAAIVIALVAGAIAATWLFMRLTGIWYAIA